MRAQADTQNHACVRDNMQDCRTIACHRQEHVYVCGCTTFSKSRTALQDHERARAPFLRATSLPTWRRLRANALATRCALCVAHRARTRRMYACFLSAGLPHPAPTVHLSKHSTFVTPTHPSDERIGALATGRLSLPPSISAHDTPCAWRASKDNGWHMTRSEANTPMLLLASAASAWRSRRGVVGFVDFMEIP